MKESFKKISQGSPLLNQADFIRLIHSGAAFILSRRLGLPPALPKLEECPQLPLNSLKIQDHGELHRLLEQFFGVSNEAPPKPSEKIGQYAGRIFRRWVEGSREIIFYTSGSTGEPKANRHTEEMLRQEMDAVAALFIQPRRVVAAVPLLHSYGFVFGVLLAKALSLEAVDVPPLSTVISAHLKPGDLLVGFPLLFSRWPGPPPAGVQALSATAPLEEHLFDDLKKTGFSSLNEIYGASETGAVAFRSSPGPFRLLHYWWKADSNNLKRLLPKGIGRDYPLPDNASWYDERSFIPTGRKDQAVQVGGVNVYPSRVAALIEEHPLVKAGAVRLMTAEEGERLKAFIVPAHENDENQIRRELTEKFKNLSPPERPGSLSFGPELPRSTAGKAADWKIRKQ